MFRTQLTRQVRLFSTSPIVRKSPVETVKDAAKTVDRAVSDKVVKGIEKGGTYSPLHSTFAFSLLPFELHVPFIPSHVSPT